MGGGRGKGQLNPDRGAWLERLLVIAAIVWSTAVAAMLWMPPPPVVIPSIWLDKATHLILFTGLGGAWRWVTPNHWRVLLFSVAFAALTEVGQGWLPWPRQPDVVDFGFDVVGAVLGVAFASRVGPPWRRIRQRVG